MSERDKEWAVKVSENIVKRFLREMHGWHGESTAMKTLKLVVLAELLKGIRG